MSQEPQNIGNYRELQEIHDRKLYYITPYTAIKPKEMKTSASEASD